MSLKDIKPITIELPNDTPVNSQLIEYCIKAYKKESDRFETLTRYYLSGNDIRNRVLVDDSLPNNKLVHSFPKYISNIATAYFMGRGVKYETEDEEYKNIIDDILSDNYSDSRNFEEAKEMSINGVSYELLYINEEGKFKTQYFKADEIIPIYASSLGKFLMMAIRLYSENRIDGSSNKYAEVYTDKEIITFIQGKVGSDDGWEEMSRRNHLMSDVPIIIRRNNEERKGDFEDVKSLIDAYDRSQSDTMNDLDYFTDAYLTVFGVDDIVEEEDSTDGTVRQKQTKGMKQRRTLYFPEGGDAKFLIKDINDTATENFKTRIYKDIFFLSQVPNLTDETFSGNLSGVAIKYKLFGLEELSAEKEKYWKSAERKKLKLMTEYINTLKGTKYDWKTIKVSFDRSQIANLFEISQMMNNLRDILSQKTIIELFPEVENAQEELDRFNEERANSENNGTPPEVVY
ncbi:MAG: phage portal protein [Clostridium sp.]|nr:phage portal protein [Clostridium sp.]